MRIVCWFLVSLLCFLPLVHGRLSPDTCDSPGSCDHRVKTLLLIIGEFGNPQVFEESWQGNDPCQNWYGIDCIEGVIVSVTFLSLNLTGSISPRFADLRFLEMIDVSHNHLTGIIPPELTTLHYLDSMDVSYNNLHGKVPRFRSVVPDTEGNPQIETSSIQVPSESSNKKSSSLEGIIVGLVVVVSLLIIGGGFLAFCFYMKVKQSSVPEPNETVAPDIQQPEMQMQIQQPREHSGSEIPMQVLRVATDYFGSNNIIGRGGFGTVYKGIMQDGKEIAVKRMHDSGIGGKGLDQFKAEISVLTKVQHCNLVVFQGYCIEESERLLVYQYMPGGSLSGHLFHWKDQGLQPLEWSRRLIVALDVARGVEYLHTLARQSQSYIHRDLKPSNILLGEDMRAKVSDFGLVRSTEEGRESIKTKNGGTCGYMAPEYAMTGRITRKIDVYSFGVVLMELITGHAAMDEKRSGKDAVMATWFKKMFAERDSFAKIIDETIEVNEETQGSISQVAELAGYCCAKEPEHRPEMSHVVSVLTSLVEHWKPSEVEEDNATLEMLTNWTLDSGTTT